MLRLRPSVLATLVSAAVAACGAVPPPSAPPAPAARAAAPAFELVETVPVETTLDHPALRDAAGVWLEMIAAARTSIDLGRFYASNQAPGPLEPIVGALEAAARIPHVAVRLSTIPVWSGGFVPFARVTHAKALVIDGKRGWLGTGNWEKDFFYKDRNVGVLVDDPVIADQLAGCFATLWQSSYAVPVDPYASYTPPRIE